MTSIARNVSVLAAALLALCLAASPGWATRLPPGVASGQITALPGGSTIEVAHRTYRVKANSPAEKALGSVAAGQQVELVLDGPPGNPDSQVVSISTQQQP